MLDFFLSERFWGTRDSERLSLLGVLFDALVAGVRPE